MALSPEGDRLALEVGTSAGLEIFVYEPRRESLSKLTFGNGLHLCLGAPLARLELREMTKVLLARTDDLPHLRWEPDGCERRAGIVHRFTALRFSYG